jgi:hypothetical protein
MRRKYLVNLDLSGKMGLGDIDCGARNWILLARQVSVIAMSNLKAKSKYFC